MFAPLLVALGALPVAAEVDGSWYASGLSLGTDPKVPVIRSVAISGDLAVVGSDGDSREDVGFVEIFERESVTGQWLRVAVLSPEDGDEGDAFGYRVATDGTIVVAGAYADDDLGLTAGAVYPIERDPETGEWEITAKLFGSDVGYTSYLGFRVCASEGRILATSKRERDAYVFERDPETGEWFETAKLLVEENGHGSPPACALSGDTLALGYSGALGPAGHRSGVVHVFEHDADSGDWDETAELAIEPPIEPEPDFGGTVGLSGATLVVGTAMDLGSAYVYERRPETGAWELAQVLESAWSPGDDGYGSRVAAADDLIAVSAPYDGAFGEYGSSGTVYVYERDAETGTWEEIAQLLPLSADPSVFGWSLAVSDDTVLVEEPSDDPGPLVYFHARTEVDPAIERTGSCPGETTLTVSGLTPFGWATVYRAAAVGESSPNPRCPTLDLALDNPHTLVRVQADELGNASRTGVLTDEHCASLLQVVDQTACAASAVEGE